MLFFLSSHHSPRGVVEVLNMLLSGGSQKMISHLMVIGTLLLMVLSRQHT